MRKKGGPEFECLWCGHFELGATSYFERFHWPILNFLDTTDRGA